jgi:hypothetical protein
MLLAKRVALRLYDPVSGNFTASGIAGVERTDVTTAIPDWPDSETVRTAIESVDREIAFYRSRSGQIYLFALSAEALIIVGREKLDIDKAEAWVSPLLASLAFISVAVVGTVLGAEYRRRIHDLKRNRTDLLSKLNLYPAKRLVSEIQVLYYVLWLTSAAGCGIAWLRAYPENPAVIPVTIAYGIILLLVSGWGLLIALAPNVTAWFRNVVQKLRFSIRRPAGSRDAQGISSSRRQNSTGETLRLQHEQGIADPPSSE